MSATSSAGSEDLVTSGPIGAYPGRPDINDIIDKIKRGRLFPPREAAPVQLPAPPSAVKELGESPVAFDNLYDNALQGALRLYRGYTKDSELIASASIGISLKYDQWWYGDDGFAERTVQRLAEYIKMIHDIMAKSGIWNASTHFPWLPFPGASSGSGSLRQENIVAEFGWRVAQVICGGRRVHLNSTFFQLPVRRLAFPSDMNGSEPWPMISSTPVKGPPTQIVSPTVPSNVNEIIAHPGTQPWWNVTPISTDEEILKPPDAPREAQVEFSGGGLAIGALAVALGGFIYYASGRVAKEK